MDKKKQREQKRQRAAHKRAEREQKRKGKKQAFNPYEGLRGPIYSRRRMHMQNIGGFLFLSFVVVIGFIWYIISH